MTFVRQTLAVIGIPLVFVVTLAATLAFAPAPAEAGCSTTSVCYRTIGGRRVCKTESQCISPRIRRCTFVNRCTPQRTCVSTPGRSSCVYRDVCRRVEVCN